MKDRYIMLMNKTLSAYSNEHIKAYFDSVKREGLTEHGFPRLTSNIGILISHGLREDLYHSFCEMMDFCCESIPKVKAANDFSVREIIFCLMALEERNTVPEEKLNEWKQKLATIDPESCYSKFAKQPTDKVNNWACFTAVSEYMRHYIGLCDSLEFIDIQIASQLQPFDENGMYRDPNNPMVYDLVPRDLFSMLLHFGYRGKYYEEIDRYLKKAGLLTLQMQSVSGEIPFGGRSAQFLYTEALLAIVSEYEARRYAAESDFETASKFKKAVEKAIDNIEMWLERKPIGHVKNYFPLESRYGCEKYAYFDKYMITVASYLYCAYLLCDDSIPESQDFKTEPYVFSTSEHFHKSFLYSNGYFLEFDTAADRHYDASGLGRVHKDGAPSAICLSLPCTATPKYKIDIEDAVDLSLCAGADIKGKLHFATDESAYYEVISLSCDDHAGYADVCCTLFGEKKLQTKYMVDENGVSISVSGDGRIAHMIPAFCFDGEEETKIAHDEHQLTVEYRGWVCRYTTDGIVCDTGKIACNRNGHYRVFRADGEGELSLHIEIHKA